jgi:hypothetical protein
MSAEVPTINSLSKSITIFFRDESCHGGMSEGIINVLACTATAGSEKMPPLINGKSEKLRCFKHGKFLPCTQA